MLLKKLAAYSLAVTLVANQTLVFACPHNFNTDKPIATAFLASRSADQAKIIVSLVGESLGKLGQNPLKILVVDKKSTLGVHKLRQDELDSINTAVTQAEGLMQRGEPVFRGGSRGISKGLGGGDEVSIARFIIGNSLITLKTFEKSSSRSLYSDLAEKYNFESRNEEAMNEKFTKIMATGEFNIVVATAEPLNPTKPEKISIAVEISKTLGVSGKRVYEDNLTAEYLDVVSTHFTMNAWISRAYAGGMVGFIKDIPYGKYKATMEDSPRLWFNWSVFYGGNGKSTNYDGEKKPILGRKMAVDQVGFKNDDNSTLLEVDNLREIKFFEEKFSPNGQGLNSLEATGGTMIYAPGK